MAETWRRLGRVLQATGGPLDRTHAMLPTPHVMADRVRVFFTACDDDMRGRVFFADLEPAPPFAVMARSPGPVLDVGPPGAFDGDGANPSQALVVDGRLALAYIGWRRGPPQAPYTLFAAVAFSDDEGLSFRRASEPMLKPLAGERLFRTAPFLEARGNQWRLLYIGGDAFVMGADGRARPTYSLMELEGPSPFDWTGPGRVLMAPGEGELGFGRPVAYTDPDGARRLMISVRTEAGYRLVETIRDLDPAHGAMLTAVVPGPLEDWEREMTCFGAPCTVGPYELLFYNGDGFGRTGAGLLWRARG